MTFVHRLSRLHYTFWPIHKKVTNFLILRYKNLVNILSSPVSEISTVPCGFLSKKILQVVPPDLAITRSCIALCMYKGSERITTYIYV